MTAPYYAANITRNCDPVGCKKTATHEVRSGRDGPISRHCQPHAQAKVNELNDKYGNTKGKS
jgi:hypothetical protein